MTLARLAPVVPHLDRLIEVVDARTKADALAPLERRLRRSLVAMWRRQATLLIDALGNVRWRFAEALRVSEAGPIPDPELDRIWLAVTAATASGTVATLDAVGVRALRNGHRHAAADVGLDVAFDLEHPRAVAHLADYGARRVTGVNATTRQGINRLLVTAGEEGWSYGRTSREIRSQFRGFGTPSPLAHIRDRGELVAVTEMGEAYEAGQRMVIGQLAEDGVATEKAWDETGDARVCAVCQAGSDAEWIAGDEQFPNGFEGPLGHPGCRCALTIRVAERSRVVPST